MRNPLSFMQDRRRARHTDTPPPVEQAPVEQAPKHRRSIRDAIKDAVGTDAYDKVSSPSTQMSVALAHKNGPTYAGTVPAAEKARRRAANKRARIARRANR